MSDLDEMRRALKEFVALFDDDDFCRSIAPRVTCHEAEVIASVLYILGHAVGHHDPCRTWLEWHSDGDSDPGNLHHIPDVPDDASGAEGTP